MKDLFIGLMSGTSLDGIDSALVELSNKIPKIINAHFIPFSPEIKKILHSLNFSNNNEINTISYIEPIFSNLCADTVNQLIRKSGLSHKDIIAIGSHGHTIRHIPHQGYTLQIGDSSLITEKTGITVVSDFRKRDIAAGGQGAPLAAAFHAFFFRKKNKKTAIVNIGGIANVTLLNNQNIIGFDIGPGNSLMDLWCQKNINKPFDNNGNWAKTADYDLDLLQYLLQEPYFNKSIPKSTGKELFNLEWLEKKLLNFKTVSTSIIQSTLCQLTAFSIIASINRFMPGIKNIYLCGGGAFNKTLRNRMQSLTSAQIKTTSDLGLDPSLVEATAFAWLAKQTINGNSSNLPQVTGASGKRILGAIHPH